MKKLVIKGEKTMIAPTSTNTKHGILTTKNGQDVVSLEYIYFAEATGLYYSVNQQCEVKQDGHTYKSDAPINLLSGQNIGTLNENQSVQFFDSKIKKKGYFVDLELP